MKKSTITIALFLCACFIGNVTRANYTDTTIKKIAILPFNVFLDTTNLPTGVTPKGILRKSDVNRFRYQRALYTWFTRKSFKYNEIFQELTTTNDLLTKSSLTDSIDVLAKQQLCTALGVDAVILGSIHIINLKETVGNEVMTQVVGISFHFEHKVRMEISMYDHVGNVLWKKEYNGHAGESPERAINDFLKEIYKTFPYKK